MPDSLLKQVKTIPMAGRKITKAGNRYMIYLPTELNEIWRELHEKKVELNVIIEISERGER
jgi:tRNA1(Val) A37 N6-methylase TrmN6